MSDGIARNLLHDKDIGRGVYELRVILRSIGHSATKTD